MWILLSIECKLLLLLFNRFVFCFVNVLFCLCRPCSTATFGRPPPFTVQAELVIPSYLDENMCGPLSASVHPNVIKRKQAQATSTSSLDDALGMLNRRFRNSFLGRRFIGGQQDEEEAEGKANLNSDEVEGKIAMTFRGVCLFEDKANVAVVEGASALIIRNREVFTLTFLILIANLLFVDVEYLIHHGWQTRY